MRIDNVLDDWDEETLQIVNPGTPLEKVIFQTWILRDRQLFKTEKGRFGFGKKGVEKGDRLAIFNGAPVPFIWRDGGNSTKGKGREGVYKLFGEAYVHGLMDGEVHDLGLEERDIELV